MALTRIALNHLAWTQGAHPLERKKMSAERPVALVEFAPGFEDPNLCTRAHFIFVVSGELELESRAGVERFVTGECCVIDRGTEHRARNNGREAVTLLIASELELPVAG